jgi:cytochrome P450
VLVKRADMFHKTRSTKKLLAVLLGSGLVSLEGDDHRRHRRIMQPTFHLRHVQQMTQVIVDNTAAWVQQTSANAVDILPEMANLMLSIVVGTFFSAHLTETSHLRTALQGFSQALDLRVRSPLPLPDWLPTKHNRMLRRAVTTLDKVVHDLIAERRQHPNASADLLTGLLTAQDETTGLPLTDQEIRDEIATVFFTGYETTTTTLAWVWYLLATHPNVREKLHAEITQVLQGAAPEAQHLRQMPYLDQVIKEVLRLYPAGWLFDREPIATTTLAGYTIPAGQTIFISPYLVHRNPAYFAAPDEFQPERFANDAETKLPRFAYFPFGGGARVCIGQSFALHTLALIIATVLPRLRLELIPGQTIRPTAAATLVPAGGIQMRLHRL